MANVLVEAPVGATKIAVWAAASGGRLAFDVGERMARRVQPGYVPPETIAQQAILRSFEGRLSIVDLIDKKTSDGELVDRAYATADAMVDEGLVDQHTAIELHPVLPRDALRDPVLNERRERALELLQLAFEEDHNVMAVPYSHPITPSEHEDSPLDIGSTWEAFAPELHGLAHQFQSDRDYEPAMLAITAPAYEQAMFGGHIAVAGESGDGRLLVLEYAGRLPEDTVLTRTG